MLFLLIVVAMRDERRPDHRDAHTADGRFDTRLAHHGVAELDRLAERYNHMAEQLAQTLVHNARLEQDQAFIRAVNERLEEERRGIARELHDTTAQHLAALKINFVRLFEHPELNEDAREALAAQGRQLLDQALHELRTLTYILHPPVLEQFGLVGALSDFATGITRRNGVKVTLDAEDYQGRLPPTVELTLFRVVQEAVTNAIRHSGTERIVVHLAKDAKEVRLAIQDFGRGLPQHPASLFNAGVGIGSMKERLFLVGGKLNVDSGEQGVTVRATVPIPAAMPTQKEA